jgi:hypothetical protein
MILATSEESISFTIIIYLQLVWWPAAGRLSKYSFTKLMVMHELREFSWMMLLFAALRTSERQEGEHIA